MTYTQQVTTRDAAKSAARDLRAQYSGKGTPISHGHALDLIAKAEGYRDWNGFSAFLKVQEARALPQIGDRITATYLGQNQTGEILKSDEMSQGRTRITILLDEAVDVVKFDSFSAYRQRITSVIGEHGESFDKTSDGNPVLKISLEI